MKTDKRACYQCHREPPAVGKFCGLCSRQKFVQERERERQYKRKFGHLLGRIPTYS